jgi:hypothetical protein
MIVLNNLDILGKARLIDEVSEQDEYFWTNPSIVFFKGFFFVSVKGVNFNRQKIWLKGKWDYGNDEESFLNIPLRLIKLDREFNFISANKIEFDIQEISNHFAGPINSFRDETGGNVKIFLEDLRLIILNDKLAATGRVNVYGYTNESLLGIKVKATLVRQFVAIFSGSQLIDLKIIPSVSNSAWENNWSVFQNSKSPILFCVNFNSRALLSVDWTSASGEIVEGCKPEDFVWRGGWSGSTPFVRFGDKYIGILHRKSDFRPEVYAHMFVLCDDRFVAERVSEPFSFEGFPIEFCCGISHGPNVNSLIISFSEWDRSALFLEMSLDTIRDMLVKKINSNCDLYDIALDEETLPLLKFAWVG